MDNRAFRLNDEQEVEELAAKYGNKFLAFKEDVFNHLRNLQPGIWIPVSSIVKSVKLLPAFIKCVCIFMLDNNTLEEWWDFDDTYENIRRIKHIPTKPLKSQKWNEKKQ